MTIPPATLINTLERIAQMAASNAVEAATQAIRRNGVTTVRGTVTEVAADNKVYVLRDTSLRDDGTPGDPDPQPYQVLSPGKLPVAGDRVHGVSWAGGTYILGTEAGAGYKDLSAVAAGDLDDLSLTGSKLADDSVDPRIIAPDGVTGNEVLNRGLSGNVHLALRTVDTGEIAISAVGGTEVASRSIAANVDVVQRSVDTGEIALSAVGGSEIGNRSIVASVDVAQRSVDTAEIALSAVGGNEIGNRSIVATEDIVLRSVGGGEIILNTIGSGEVGTDAVNYSELGNEAVGFDSIQADVVGDYENDGSLARQDHTHSSTAFIRYPKRRRLRMLEERRQLEELLSSGDLTQKEDVLAKNLLTSLVLQMDYKHLDAHERERRFDDPEWSQWTNRYEQEYHVGLWEGHEPIETLTLDEQEERRLATAHDAAHVAASRRRGPAW